MPSIYHHEIESYKEQLAQIVTTIDNFFQNRGDKNLPPQFAILDNNDAKPHIK